MHPFRTSVAVFLCGLAAGPFQSPRAQAADDWIASYSDDSHYTVTYSNMPDFDQRRPQLPGNGDMYCLPTAAINCMAFLANHGQPQLPPGPGVWQTQSMYDQATSAIASMGSMMGTDPVDGTGGGEGFFGMALWLAADGIGDFLPSWYAVVHMSSDSDGYVPRFSELSMHALSQRVVVPVVGWYVYYNQFPLVGYRREGGHALTLTKVIANGGSNTIYWRDPADDVVNGSQSGFDSQFYPVQAETIGLWPFNVNRTLDKIVGYGSARLDGFFAIVAPFCITTSGELAVLNIFKAGSLVTGEPELWLHFPSPNSQSILDAVIHPAGLDCYVLTAGDVRTPTKVWSMTPLTGESAQVLSLADARKIAFDRFRKLYVLDGDTLRSYGVLDIGTPVQQASVRAPTQPHAIAVDDRGPSTADVRVYALSLTTRQILCFALGSTQPPVIQSLPASLQLGGDASLTVNHLDGSLWVTSTESDELYRLVTNAEGVLVSTTVGRDSLITPGDICVGDNGHVLVSTFDFAQGLRLIVEFEPLTNGTWRRVTTSPFAGQPAARALRVMRSHSNHDSLIHEGPAYRNVLPTQFGPSIPDCPGPLGDANCDGVVDFFDIDYFLQALFESDAYAAHCGGTICTVDINCSGAVDFFDIDPFTNCLFGACPPCP